LVATLDARQDVEADNGSRRTFTLDPRQQGLVVEGLPEANDGTVELPIAIAEPAHVVDERVPEGLRIVRCLEQRFRKK